MNQREARLAQGQGEREKERRFELYALEHGVRLLGVEDPGPCGKHIGPGWTREAYCSQPYKHEGGCR